MIDQKCRLCLRECKAERENGQMGFCGMTGKDDAEKAEKFISWIEELKEKMDIPQYIDPIPEKDEDQIIRWAMKEGNPIYPTPVYWGYTEFKKALRYCQGKDV